jgi:hypothetical protein
MRSNGLINRAKECGQRFHTELTKSLGLLLRMKSHLGKKLTALRLKLASASLQFVRRLLLRMRTRRSLVERSAYLGT